MERNENFDRVCTRVAKTHDVSKERATAIVETAFDAIRDGVDEGPIRIPGFGTFKLYEQEAREYENPETGETVDVPWRRKFAFEASEEINDEIKQVGAA